MRSNKRENTDQRVHVKNLRNFLSILSDCNGSDGASLHVSQLNLEYCREHFEFEATRRRAFVQMNRLPFDDKAGHGNLDRPVPVSKVGILEDTLHVRDGMLLL